MAISFRYKNTARVSFPSETGPFIPVVLKGKENIQVLALLDSGADFSAIPLGIAKILGADLSGEWENVGGIGGKVKAKSTDVTVYLQKGHEAYTFSVPVKVLDSEEVPPILGRHGFFDKFEITFKESEKRVILKHITKPD